MHRGLDSFRVVDVSSGIAAAYCAKLMADAGADVIKIEPPAGDPMRAWSASGATPSLDVGGDLFRFLHHGTRSVASDIGDPIVNDLFSSADIVIDSASVPGVDAEDLVARYPGLVFVSITPYGRTGPWADRPVTEFIVQAELGGLSGRGRPASEPVMAGGRTSEWLGASFAAVAGTAAALRARRTGHGEVIDAAVSEAMTIGGGNYAEISHWLSGLPEIHDVPRKFETPSIAPTLDGYVGFCTNSRQQFDDFLLLIERPDLGGDETLATSRLRQDRFEEWNDIVRQWTSRRTTAEIVELASLLRIPVAPVCGPAEVLGVEHFVARGVYVDDPTGTFKMPRRPWRIDDQDPPAPRPSPRLGEHTGLIDARVPSRPRPAATPARLPLDGLRVVDLTAWWAGPLAAGVVAALGAEVVHVESTGRPDGMRMTGARHGMDGPWWERSSHYLSANTNKLGVTLDLSTDRGRGLLAQLIAISDVVIENFTPRVLGNFGLGWESIQRLNERAILLRMPAFGLSGPWRDNPGFAQTMEQVSGLAWLTGETWDQPRVQGGPCDPIAGMHAVFALLVALTERDATGRGSQIEVAMVESALNVAAELVVEYSSSGHELARTGNRSPSAAPQGLYRCTGFDRWLALSIETDDHWRGLRAALGDPAWASDPKLDSLATRRAEHDLLDHHIGVWAAERDVDDAVDLLVGNGVPAGCVRDLRRAQDHPQLRARHFYEEIHHPVAGSMPTPTVPFRYRSVERWLRTPAPLMGEHNREVLGGWLGVADAELAELEAAGIIGSRPRGL